MEVKARRGDPTHARRRRRLDTETATKTSPPPLLPLHPPPPTSPDPPIPHPSTSPAPSQPRPPPHLPPPAPPSNSPPSSSAPPSFNVRDLRRCLISVRDRFMSISPKLRLLESTGVDPCGGKSAILSYNNQAVSMANYDSMVLDAPSTSCELGSLQKGYVSIHWGSRQRHMKNRRFGASWQMRSRGVYRSLVRSPGGHSEQKSDTTTAPRTSHPKSEYEV